MAIRFSLDMLVIMYIFHLKFYIIIPLVCTNIKMCRTENDTVKIWGYFTFSGEEGEGEDLFMHWLQPIKFCMMPKN